MASLETQVGDTLGNIDACQRAGEEGGHRVRWLIRGAIRKSCESQQAKQRANDDGGDRRLAVVRATDGPLEDTVAVSSIPLHECEESPASGIERGIAGCVGAK